MRTKGATSCVGISKRLLNKHFGPDAIIQVSRQQLQQLGLVNLPKARKKRAHKKALTIAAKLSNIKKS